MKLDSKYFDRIRTRPRGQARVEPSAPVCQWDGCDKTAVHRAPVGRNAEGEYFMFCFEHVKEYNKGYNYFSGLSDTEIARYQKEAVTGHRPTWTVGVNKSARNGPTQSQMRSGTAGAQARMRDPFGFFNEARARRHQGGIQGARQEAPPRRKWRRQGVGRPLSGGYSSLPIVKTGWFLLTTRIMTEAHFAGECAGAGGRPLWSYDEQD